MGAICEYPGTQRAGRAMEGPKAQELRHQPIRVASVSPRGAKVRMREHPVLALQRTVGNRSTASLLHRASPVDLLRRAAEEQGRPLGREVRARLEPTLGADLSEIRVHDGPAAAAAASGIAARAYTIGSDIYLGSAAASTSEIDRLPLLAHEAVHSVQQGLRRVEVGEAVAIDHPHSPAEHEAESIAGAIEAGSMEMTQTNARESAAPGTVQRQEEGKKAAGTIKESVEAATDIWGHIKHLTGKEKPEEKSWHEPSEDAARHAKQAFDALEGAFEAIHEKRLYGGDEAGARKAAEIAEHFKKGGELVEAGAKGFEFIVKAYETYELFEEAKEAAKELSEVDLTKEGDRERAAQAFDKAFTVLGKIGKRAPKGPWSAYFELLTHFGDGRGFFTSVTQGLDPTRRERERRIFPEIEGFGKEPPPARKRQEDERKTKLEDVGADVDAKIEANLGAVPYPHDRATITINRDLGFKKAYEELMDLKRQYDALSFLSRTFKRGAAGDLAKQIVSVASSAIEALTLIEKLFDQYQVEVSFANDVAALRKAP
jgi:hypothetical protein